MPVDGLLDFYAHHARDLPWRSPDASPWAVLVSEVMLQQTPVSRVLPVYRSWLARWPTPSDLARDSPGEAIRDWDRLGYPRRALRLHAAATAIAHEFAGQVPDTVEKLLRLPGIGEYTARAVAAFAFAARAPVIDTNVRRVLSRLVRGVDSIRETATAADRRELEELLPDDPATAARLSVALMEFGALICTAGTPACASCPVAANCRWRSAGYPPGTAGRAVQSWHGSDRQLRGSMMALVRAAEQPVPQREVLAVSEEPERAARCLDGLVTDGLLRRTGSGAIGLPT